MKETQHEMIHNYKKTISLMILLTWLFLPPQTIADGAPATQPGRAVLQAHIKIPRPLLSKGVKRNRKTKQITEEYTYGGDVRIGDLTSDGTPDFVIFKSVAGLKPCYIAAFTWGGKILWQWGDKDRRVASQKNDRHVYTVESPSRPGPVCVVDIDGDQQVEVIALVLPDEIKQTDPFSAVDMEFVILDGRTGRVECHRRPEPLASADAYDKKGRRRTPNYVHQRILATDFRGTGDARDFVIKLGNTILACDQNLNVLWTYENKFDVYGRHASYIPCVGDVDTDGRDEVLGGNFLLDYDGSVLWEKMMGKHNDSVVIADIDGDLANGRECVLSGFGQVVDIDGDVVFKLGEEAVPHGQEVRVGNFRDDLKGLEIALRYRGHRNKIMFVDNGGRILQKFTVDHSPIEVGLTPVYWSGQDQPMLLYSPPALWDGYGQKVVQLAQLPEPSRRGRMGWFHCIPAQLDDSGRESIIVYDPFTDDIFVYGQAPLKQTPPTGYRHTARQYNPRLMD